MNCAVVEMHLNLNVFVCFVLCACFALLWHITILNVDMYRISQIWVVLYYECGITSSLCMHTCTNGPCKEKKTLSPFRRKIFCFPPYVFFMWCDFPINYCMQSCRKGPCKKITLSPFRRFFFILFPALSKEGSYPWYMMWFFL